MTFLTWREGAGVKQTSDGLRVLPCIDTLFVPHLQQTLGFWRAPGSCGCPGLGDKEAHV